MEEKNAAVANSLSDKFSPIFYFLFIVREYLFGLSLKCAIPRFGLRGATLNLVTEILNYENSRFLIDDKLAVLSSQEKQSFPIIYPYKSLL